MPKTKNEKNRKKKEEKYQKINEKLIALLEKDIKPWERPWHMSFNGNLITGHQYKGINPILCQIDILENGWDSPYFISFNQAKEKGWIIKKGSRATSILWASSFAVESEKENGEKVKEFRSAARWYNVFNIACVDDEKADKKIVDFIPDTQQTLNPDLRIDKLEEIIQLWPAKTTTAGEKAFYSSSKDGITMPKFEKFTSAETYYGTWLHECGHSTGHKSRLNRDMSGIFGSIPYGREELVAELTHVYLAMEFNFQTIEVELEQNASYLQSWLSLLKHDPKAFFKASHQAQQAANYILEFIEEQQPEQLLAS